MANNSYYDKQKYSTQQGIEKFHDVKYITLESREKFDKALEELDSTKYVSISAEKQRMPYYKKKLLLIGTKEKRIKKFKKLCESFLFSISPDLKLELVEQNMYQVAHNNIHKIIYVENEKFMCTWIYKDVIYRDEFTLIGLDKPKCKIEIMKSMKTPFELSRTSLVSTTIRLEFRKGWKTYINEIEKGLNQLED